MIDVLFFAVAAAICLSVFARAYKMSCVSREKNQAVVCAQQAAECFKASGEEGLKAVLGAEKEQDGVYAVYYNREFQPVQAGEDSAYAMRIIILREDGMAKARVLVEKADTTVFEIEVKKYEG